MSQLLSSNLLMLVFDFLSLQDAKNLILTCKHFKHTILDHNRFWARECLTTYLSFDLELYSETYASEDYRTCIHAKLNHLLQSNWKQLLADSLQYKKLLASSIGQLACKEEVQGFVEYFYETLKQPALPMATLKRENLVCTTQTLFQSKLSEVLYEDTGLLKKKALWVDDARKLVDRLQAHQKKIFQELLMFDKNDVLRARWYNLDNQNTTMDNDETISFAEDHSDFTLELPALPDLTKISNASTEDLQMPRCRNSLLINLHTSICGAIMHHCTIIYNYLAALNDPYLLVAEYTARWEAFVCSIMELESTFATFVELMNSQYESLFEGYPGYPKFTLWRLMTKIWMREVYDKCAMGNTLNQAFLRIFHSFREGNVTETFKNSLQIPNSGDGSPSSLPKSLFVSLRIKKKQKSLECPYRIASDLTQMPMCFKATPEMRRQLLTCYLRSIQDISLNEVSIHYLDVTDIPDNYPYCELEQSIMKQSNEFYREYQTLFSSSPEHFCQLLKSDSDLLTEILGSRTGSKLQSLQNDAGLSVMREFVSNKIDELDPETQSHYKYQLEKHQNLLGESQQRILGSVSGSGLSRQEDELRDYIEDFVEKTLEYKELNCFCPEPLEPLSKDSPCMIEEFKIPGMRSLEQKASARAVASLLEEVYGNFVPLLAFFKERQDSLQSIYENDKVLRQCNIDKNIPCDMGDVDCLFYDLDKNITVPLLEKLYEDYQVFSKQQEKQLLELQQEESRLADLSPVMRQQGMGFVQDGTGIIGDQQQGVDMLDEDMDNLDFLSLGEPVLRRNLY